MTKLVTCCVCQAKRPLAEAVSVGYTTAGWPTQLPMTLYACKSGPCRTDLERAQAARQKSEPAQRALAGA